MISNSTEIPVLQLGVESHTKNKTLNVFYRQRTVVVYFCHSKNSNSSKARAVAGCGEAQQRK